MLRQAADHQLIVFFFIVAPRLAVHLQSNQGQIFAVRRNGTSDAAAWRETLLLAVTTVLRHRVKGQIDIANQILRRTIVVAVFGLGLLCHKNL